MLLDPVINLLEKQKIKRVYASLLVFAVLFVAIYFLLSIYIPKIVLQLEALIKEFKTLSIQEQLTNLENELLKIFPFMHRGVLINKAETIITYHLENSFNEITSLFSNIFTIAALLVIVPFTTFFIVKDRLKIVKGIISTLPNKYSEMSYWIIKKVTHQLGRYVRGWLIDASFVGVACGLGFSFIGIQNSIALGIIAGLGHLVPYLGPVIVGVPAIIISIIQFGNFSAVPLILLVITIIYTFDNGFVQPYVFSKSVDIHPLLIILLIIAGSQVFGIIGMLLAVPLATVIKTASKEFYFAFKNYKISRI